MAQQFSKPEHMAQKFEAPQKPSRIRRPPSEVSRQIMFQLRHRKEILQKSCRKEGLKRVPKSCATWSPIFRLQIVVKPNFVQKFPVMLQKKRTPKSQSLPPGFLRKNYRYPSTFAFPIPTVCCTCYQWMYVSM